MSRTTNKITDKKIAEYFDTPHRTVQEWKVTRPKVYAAMRYAYGRLDEPEEIEDMTLEHPCKHLDDFVDELSCTLTMIDNVKDRLCEIVENAKST